MIGVLEAPDKHMQIGEAIRSMWDQDRLAVSLPISGVPVEGRWVII